MKKFLIYILLFFAMVAIADCLCSLICNNLQTHSRGGLTQRMEYISNSVQADILIMGSSRAHHNYVSKIIQEDLGYSVYNCGMEGMGIVNSYGLLRLIKERYAPKVIIYDLYRFDFYEDDNQKYLENLKTYKNAGVDEISEIVDPFSTLKKISSLYRYNSKLFSLIKDRMNVDSSDLECLGYYYDNSSITEDKGECLSFSTTIDSLKLKSWELFFQEIKNSDTKLIFVLSPYYRGQLSSSVINSSYELAYKNDVPIINMSSLDVVCNDSTCFKDYSHLNFHGASTFSDTLSLTIVR